MKATLKIKTTEKEFSKQDMDTFRRMLNVLRSHDLAASLIIKKKTKEEYKIYNTKLKAV